MLVYVRDAEREEVMKEIPIEEVPKHLKTTYDQENEFNYKLERD